MKMSKQFKLSIVMLIICLLASLSFGAVPRLISYQGILTDALGQPKADGAYSLTFKLYNVPTEGNNIWSETKTVNLKNGVFTATLGSDSALSLPFDTTYYLGISLTSGVEYAPRIQLTTSGYAIRAIVADSAANAYSSIISSIADSAAKSYSSDVAALATSATFADSSRVSGIADSAVKATTADNAVVAGTATSIPVSAIAANSIDSTKLGVASVGSAEIADGAIVTADVAATFKAPLAGKADSATYATLAGSVAGTSISGKIVTDSIIAIKHLGIADSTDASLVSLIVEDKSIDTASVARLHMRAGTKDGLIGVNYNSNTDPHMFIQANDYMPIKFTTSMKERMVIDSAGNVGIGTNNPQRGKLVVVEDSISIGDLGCKGIVVDKTGLHTGSVSQLTFSYGKGRAEAQSIIRSVTSNGSNGDGYLQFSTRGFTGSPVEYFGQTLPWRPELVVNNGRIGIGTTTPQSPLTIGTNVEDIVSTTGITLGASNNLIEMSNSPYGQGYGVKLYGSDDSSTLGGGKTSFRIAVRSSSYNAWNDAVFISSTDHADHSFVGIGVVGPTEKLDVAGNVKANGTVLSSDLRYKQNITPIANSLDKIQKIGGFYYDWKRKQFPNKKFSKKRQVGVIAQDVEKVFPEVVHTDKKGYKSVSYDKLTALLIEAVKEQQKQIEEQNKAIEKVGTTVEMVKNLLNENTLLRKQIASLKEKVDPELNVNLHYDLEEKK